MAAKNWVYIVHGEISVIVTDMKRSLRYPSHAIYQEDNSLINNFTKLRQTLHNVTDLADLEPNAFLMPFLEVIRSEETTGRTTGLALTSVTKFLSYGLIDKDATSCSPAVESIADAVTHARFVGTDPESDEVVLMKILYVLKTLLLSPAGCKLTNESVCEIMQSCFRICFETRLSKLLRKAADHTLVEMVQLLFTRLPEFKEDTKWASDMKKLKMRASGMQKAVKKRRPLADSFTEHSNNMDNGSPGYSPRPEDTPLSGDTPLPGDTSLPGDTLLPSSSLTNCPDPESVPSHVVPCGQTFNDEGCDPADNVMCHAEEDLAVMSGAENTTMVDMHGGLPPVRDTCAAVEDGESGDNVSVSSGDVDISQESLDYINPKGVRFIPKREGPVVPYSLPCIRELFRFLVSIMNPTDKQNSDDMTHMGISLLTVALETAVDHLSKYASLMSLVKNEMCFNLFRLLQSDKVPVFAAVLRACFLLFESMRSHLKFQLEMYLSKLMEIIVSESVRVVYEIKEMTLEAVVQLWRIPGLITELYLNYDCDLYCTNLFEDLTKLLSKNAFPVQGLFTTHVLSLEALLTILESVEAHCHSRIMAAKHAGEAKETKGRSHHTKKIMANRMAVGENMPSLEHLHGRKHRKQVLNQSIELFNQKPKQGIQFLQEQGYLEKSDEAVVKFLKETPKLSKALIGEYISRKDNPKLTETFVRSFNFSGKRVDEALRMFLETFRLPGESPVIEFLLEHFSRHWFDSNNAPFANVDAAFTLTYAIIMLNVDQHNQNAKKQNIPMKLSDFRKNVKGVNGGKDFDQEMLEEIFTAIHKSEIVLPEEQTGLVRETYMWKVLLRKGTNAEAAFVHAPSGFYDNELFSISWGPTIAALSFVFDKSQDQNIIQKALAGFRKCALISAHYGQSEVFDNLVISLCKFTTFLNSAESSEQIPILFATNIKAQLAAKTVFGLAHRHGDMLREGWKNILDCMLTLYRARLLPNTFTEVEDFLQPEGRINLIKEDKLADNRNDSGVLNSILTYFGTADANAQRGQTAEESQALVTSRQVIEECELDAMIDDTKFLRTSSLQELNKALISLCQISDLDGEGCQDEDTVVFFLELLIRVVIQNRDRAGAIWQNVREHISSIIVRTREHTFLAERAVTGLIRMAIRLLCREDVAAQVLPSLRVLLMMKVTVLRSMSRQLAYGLHLLLETNAANIHSTADWICLFTLLEVVGAGGSVPATSYSEDDQDALSDSELSPPSSRLADSDRGYTSDSELYEHTSTLSAASSSELNIGDVPNNPSWLMVNKGSRVNSSLEAIPTHIPKPPVNQFSISLNEELVPHDPKALMKSAEILNLLVRDAAHITPYNFDSCVHTVRVFVEASMLMPVPKNTVSQRGSNHKDKRHHKTTKKEQNISRSQTAPSHLSKVHVSDDEDGEQTKQKYHQLSLQMLELMHTLHTSTASIFKSWATELHNDLTASPDIDAQTSTLWRRCWCPLLQGIARLCTDSRRLVRSQALTYLQRALLVQDLNQLTALEWEACFNKVLFPLLSILLEKPTVTVERSGLEETRFRASTLLCKVFLQHLHPLLSLSTFTALWLTILDFMDKYMHADKSDQLMEAIPELLKNMLLVMNTPGTFIFTEESTGKETQLWRLTCDRLDTFLPKLKRELFAPAVENKKESSFLKDKEIAAPADTDTHAESSFGAAAAAPSDRTSSPIKSECYDQAERPTSPPADSAAPSAQAILPSSVAASPRSMNALPRRPDSPESVHRCASPLVQNMSTFSAHVQLHPPLAAPVISAPPTLLPPAGSFSGLSMAFPGSLQGFQGNHMNAGLLFSPAVSAGQETYSLLLDPHIIKSTPIPTLPTPPRPATRLGEEP